MAAFEPKRPMTLAEAKHAIARSSKLNPWDHSDGSAHSVLGPMGCFECANRRREYAAKHGRAELDRALSERKVKG